MGSYIPNANPVQAWEVTDEAADQIAARVGGRVVTETTLDGEEHQGINVPTLEGVIRASQGEFVVLDQEQVVKVYGPNRFHELYREARR